MVTLDLLSLWCNTGFSEWVLPLVYVYVCVCSRFQPLVAAGEVGCRANVLRLTGLSAAPLLP